MPTVELTDKFVRAAKCVPGRKATDYFDTIVKGLVLRASSGGQRAWYAVYGPSSKRQWLKLGTYPELALGGDQGARQRARDVRARVGDGADPIAEKRAHEASQTVRNLVENFIARRAADKRTAAAITRRLRKNVSGVIGDIKLADLHRRDITRCIDAVKDRGAAIEANRVFEDIRAMVRWARGRGDLDENLVEGMSKPTEPTSRDRVLTPGEVKAVWDALPDADMRESTRRIIRLLLITAQRESEVAGMARAEIDFDKRIWTIPGARTKNAGEHMVPLTDMAIDIIREQIADADALAKRKSREPSPFVFPAPGGHDAVTGASVPKAVKRTEEAGKIMGIAPWTPHDLRRTAATGMEELGMSPFIVGHVINHKSVTKATITSRVYARYTYDKEKREALELWAARLSAVVAGQSAIIIPLRA